jgi:hypothetical protein
MTSGMRRPALIVILALGLCAQADSPKGTPAGSGGDLPQAHCAPIGTNLAMPAYWTRSYPFVDVMKASFPFMSSGPNRWSDERPLDLDDHGWPRTLPDDQYARAMLLHGETGHPTGRMTVLYDGKGQLAYHGTIRDLKRTPGRDTFDIGPGGLFMDITRTDPEDPLRNVRVLLPGGRCGDDDFAFCERDADCGDARCVPFEETYQEQPFHPQFLEEVRPFEALRFMDWMHTNREVAQEDGVDEPHPIREMAEYPTRAHKSWRPVPIDVMVDLANLLGRDAWFNVPHTASDAFVRTFAERVAQRLRPDLQVYIEYSNEIWNTIFDQHHWVNAQGCRALSKAPERECGGKGKELCGPEVRGRAQGRCVKYGQRWFGRRTVEVGRMWREAFAGKNPERIQVVLGVQVGGHWWYVDVLRERLEGGDRVHQHVNAVATAPYFSIPEASSVDDVFARAGEGEGKHPAGTFRLLTGPPGSPYGGVLDWIREDAQALRQPDLKHLQLVAYEAGQGLHHYDPKIGKLFTQANRDARMRKVYRQYLDHWARLSNGGLLMHFSTPVAYNEHGAWGMKEGQGRPREESPKYDALLNYIARHRRCPDPQRAPSPPDTPPPPGSPDAPD